MRRTQIHEHSGSIHKKICEDARREIPLRTVQEIRLKTVQAYVEQLATKLAVTRLNCKLSNINNCHCHHHHHPQSRYTQIQCGQRQCKYTNTKHQDSASICWAAGHGIVTQLNCNLSNINNCHHPHGHQCHPRSLSMIFVTLFRTFKISKQI